MQKHVMDTLGLSKSITVDDLNQIDKYDIKGMGALFVKSMSKLLKRGVDIGAIKIELPDYVISISKVDDDIIVTYIDHDGKPVFTVDKSRKAIYESLGALYESGVFD